MAFILQIITDISLILGSFSFANFKNAVHTLDRLSQICLIFNSITLYIYALRYI